MTDISYVANRAQHCSAAKAFLRATYGGLEKSPKARKLRIC